MILFWFFWFFEDIAVLFLKQEETDSKHSI